MDARFGGGDNISLTLFPDHSLSTVWKNGGFGGGDREALALRLHGHLDRSSSLHLKEDSRPSIQTRQFTLWN